MLHAPSTQSEGLESAALEIIVQSVWQDIILTREFDSQVGD